MSEGGGERGAVVMDGWGSVCVCALAVGGLAPPFEGREAMFLVVMELVVVVMLGCERLARMAFW